MMPSSSGRTELPPDSQDDHLTAEETKYTHTKGSAKRGKAKNARTKDENKKWAPNKAAIKERAGTKYG